MKKFESHSAAEKLAQLKSNYGVDLVSDWEEAAGGWKDGSWSITELDKLHAALALLANAMGGGERFMQNLGGVTVKKAEMGKHGGEAVAHHVRLAAKGNFSAWTVVHEMAHAWDANYKWNLSAVFERYTGGYTNRTLAKIKKLLGTWDAGPQGEEETPGRHGRLRGCNQAGYFYGDKPSGSNWNFNRREDFAESVTMYLGWKRDNDLSKWAEARIKRYALANGVKDDNFGIDNWADYSLYFYPEGGDYATTKRWKFVDELMHGKIDIT